jgi:hypothetical protein
MPNNRQDFVGPILLAIFAYLASMLTRAFQRSLELDANSEARRGSKRNAYMEHIVFDNFLTDPLISNTLQDVKLWEDCTASGSKWWDGKSEPNNIWEELNQIIWRERPEFQIAAGFEYWCEILNNGDGSAMSWYIDKGELFVDANCTPNNHMII